MAKRVAYIFNYYYVTSIHIEIQNSGHVALIDTASAAIPINASDR